MSAEENNTKKRSPAAAKKTAAAAASKKSTQTAKTPKAQAQSAAPKKSTQAKPAAKPKAAETKEAATVKPTAAPSKATAKPTAKAAEKPAAKAAEKPAAKTAAKPATKATEKPAAKTTAKPATKAAEKPATKATEKPAPKKKKPAVAAGLSQVLEEAATLVEAEPVPVAEEAEPAFIEEQPAVTAEEPPKAAEEPVEEPASEEKEEPVAEPDYEEKPAVKTRRFTLKAAPQSEVAFTAEAVAEIPEPAMQNEQEAESEPEKSPEKEAEKEPEKERSGGRFFRRVLDRAETASPDKVRKKLMKKFRRIKKIPSGDEVERFNPPAEKGLTSEQVLTRFHQFLFNDVNKRYSKSYKSIFIGNICTFFNLLCVIVAVAFVIAQASISQFIFMAIFAANLFLGILQEILAKKQVDRLSLLINATAKVVRDGSLIEIPIKEIVLDDVLVLEAGQQIPADCILIDGSVEVNESLLTGESAAIKKGEGDILYAGSFISSGSCHVRAEKVGKASYINNLTSKAKQYKRPKSEIMNSIRLFIRVIGCAIVPLAAVMFYANWKILGAEGALTSWSQISESIQLTGAVIVGMIPSGLILLTSIAMALGVRRLYKKQTLVQDLYSLEMLARVDTLCLDKTGTITDGRMTVNDCMILSSFPDYTIEEIMGSMLAALDDNNQTSIALQNRFGHSTVLQPAAILPFSSKRKLSAVTFKGVGTFAFGAPEFVLRPLPPRIERIYKQYSQMGLRVLLLAHAPGKMTEDRLPTNLRPIAIITLADNIRPEAVETIKWFRENDVDIRIISGDNPVTVSEVARRVGVRNASKFISLDGLTDIEVENVANQYTVFGRVTPEQKAVLVKTLKREGHTVAMTGDGVNDILALKDADCAISVASGSEAARNVSHLVLMNNNFMNLPTVVEEGRRIINNIKNSASLYIMKTLFTMLLAITCLILQSPYFFKTNNLLLFEIFVAAVPSMVISLQSNNERVKGRFIPYVLSRSIPGALTLLLCVVAVYLGNMFLPFDVLVKTVMPDGSVVETTERVVGFGLNYTPMLIVAVTFGGIVMLYRILKPMNFTRALVYGISLAVCIFILSVPTLGNIIYNNDGGRNWADVQFNLMEIIYTLLIMLTAFPVSAFLVRGCDLFIAD